MADPNEAGRQVEGESGMTYAEIVVPDPERGGETTAVVPPEGEVYSRQSEGE